MKLIIHPNAFDDFDGSQEELDEILDNIQAAFEDGTLLDEAIEVEEGSDIWETIQKPGQTRQ